MIWLPCLQIKLVLIVDTVDFVFSITYIKHLLISAPRCCFPVWFESYCSSEHMVRRLFDPCGKYNITWTQILLWLTIECSICYTSLLNHIHVFKTFDIWDRKSCQLPLFYNSLILDIIWFTACILSMCYISSCWICWRSIHKDRYKSAVLGDIIMYTIP